MLPVTGDTFIPVSLFGGLVFWIYYWSQIKELPALLDICSIIIAISSLFAAIEYSYCEVIEGHSDQKIIIAIGGVCVFYVALTSILNLFKRTKKDQDKRTKKDQDKKNES